MEKQRIKRTIKSRKRLLILGLFIFGAALYGQSNAAVQNNQNLVPVDNQKLFPNQDIKYEIYIPKAKSGNVQIQNQSLNSSIELKTVRKSDYYQEEGGTLIELWYRFDKKGTYRIPRLTLLINGRRRFYNFEPLVIEEDPANRMPRIVIEFDNGTRIYSDGTPTEKPIFTQEVGKKINFTINLQFSTQLVQFNWEIPQDSIFTQTKTYEFTEIKYREKNYTNELIPIADFEWTALSKGTGTIPKIKLSATAYKGYRTELTMPAFLINFTDSQEELNLDNELDSLFDEAFDEEYNFSSLSTRIIIDEKTCNSLAELRSKERSVPFAHLKYRQERRELENTLGLPSDQEEFNLGFLYLFAMITVFFIITLLFFLKRKNSIGVIINSVVLTCAIALCAYSAAKASKKYAISLGCTLTSIPEEKSNSTSEIAAGNRVVILESTDNWYFVELGTISGWCKKDQIILIK